MFMYINFLHVSGLGIIRFSTIFFYYDYYYTRVEQYNILMLSGGVMDIEGAFSGHIMV